MSNDIDTLFGDNDLKAAVKNVHQEEISKPKTLTHNFKLISRGNGPFREKYRPQRFNEIIPTCSIELLRNQVDNPNGSCVFLMEGNTGTGKTTCARVLAKANICLATNPQDKPCLKCDPCKNFDSSFDKIELNAANQNKIEDVRALVEDMRYSPSIYKKKIYILDEVQRLTQPAQQVLLTTLENPYPYLLVFLCTTDIQEINKALVDRACRITFNKITASQARSIIDQVFEQEKLTASDDILESLFLQSKGSIRALLNNIQAYSQNGYNAQIWPEDEVSNEIGVIFKYINTGNWADLSKLLMKPDTRKDPEAIRFGLENYTRAIILKTGNFNEAIKLGNILMRISGSMITLPLVAQYNELVLRCLRACAASKPTKLD